MLSPAAVRRLACIYALLDQSDIVDVPHLKAALAVRVLVFSLDPVGAQLVHLLDALALAFSPG